MLFLQLHAQVKANLDFSNCIIQTKDGGYALTGKTYPNGGNIAGVYVVNLDSTGNTNWTKTISGKYDESGNSVIQTRDGGYALTGETYSNDFSGQDVYVVKLMPQVTLSGPNLLGAWMMSLAIPLFRQMTEAIL